MGRCRTCRKEPPVWSPPRSSEAFAHRPRVQHNIWVPWRGPSALIFCLVCVGCDSGGVTVLEPWQPPQQSGVGDAPAADAASDDSTLAVADAALQTADARTDAGSQTADAEVDAGSQPADAEVDAGSADAASDAETYDGPQWCEADVCVPAPDADCVGERLGDKLYFFCRAGNSWADARTKCQAIGSELARVDSSLEDAWVRTHAAESIGADTWIGASDQGEEGQWRWADGGDLFWTGSQADDDGLATGFSGWLGIEPSNSAGSEDCACYREDANYGWNDEGCDEQFGFVCEPPCTPSADCGGLQCGAIDNGCGVSIECGSCSGSDACQANRCAAPLSAPASGCTQDSFGGHTYWFCTDTMTWADARTACTDIGADLARPDGSAEDGWMQEQTRTLIAARTYIGGTDSSDEGQWLWADDSAQFWSGQIDGEPKLYSNFAHDEPDESGDCLAYRSARAYLWVDGTCNDSHAFICEAAP